MVQDLYYNLARIEFCPDRYMPEAVVDYIRNIEDKREIPIIYKMMVEKAVYLMAREIIPGKDMALGLDVGLEKIARLSVSNDLVMQTGPVVIDVIPDIKQINENLEYFMLEAA